VLRGPADSTMAVWVCRLGELGACELFSKICQICEPAKAEDRRILEQVDLASADGICVGAADDSVMDVSGEDDAMRSHGCERRVMSRRVRGWATSARKTAPTASALQHATGRRPSPPSSSVRALP
jgi:hypothetical protein